MKTPEFYAREIVWTIAHKSDDENVLVPKVLAIIAYAIHQAKLEGALAMRESAALRCREHDGMARAIMNLDPATIIGS